MFFSLFSHRRLIFKVESSGSAGARKRNSTSGYFADRELRIFKSLKGVGPPEQETTMTKPDSSIVSNSRHMVLSDLARMLQPTENGPSVLP
jgi:hypothetical protein